MPTATPPTDPDGLAVFHALGRDDLPTADAYNALEGIRHMAGHAVISTLEAHRAELSSKLDARTGVLESKIDSLNARLDAQDAKLRMLMWTIGAAVAVIGILIRLLG